jgi:hypothetical protein
MPPLRPGVRLLRVSWRLLLVPVLLIGSGACAGGDTASSPGSTGYSYAPPEQLPHPGIAEGRATVEVNGVTFYACPPLAVGKETPLIEDSCLTPGDAGASKYGDYSMLEPSVDCPDGNMATDAGGLGWGFVGQPLIAQRETPPGSPGRAAVLDCLRAAGRG